MKWTRVVPGVYRKVSNAHIYEVRRGNKFWILRVTRVKDSQVAAWAGSGKRAAQYEIADEFDANVDPAVDVGEQLMRAAKKVEQW
ncbi:hypothetical protein [Saccharopolyspora shandongensis]|uniref:hypothetical protein n=1 Tax=Saccharopolyspora shandongensis TaxID=418495 RepID=UPI0033C287C6